MKEMISTSNERMVAYRMALAGLPQAGIWFRAVGMHRHAGTVEGVLRALDRLRQELQVLLDCPDEVIDGARESFALSAHSMIPSADSVKALRLAIETLPSADQLFRAVSARGDGVSAAAVFACLEELRRNWYLRLDALHQGDMVPHATSAPRWADHSIT